MTRRKAFLLNTLFFVLAAIALTGLTVWLHPGPLLVLNRIEKPLLVTLALGAIAGPALMLYLFKPGKKGLWLDVTTLLLLQALVWGYGAWLIWQERPGWLVTGVDRIVMIRANAIDPDAITNPNLRRPTPGQPQLVVARLSGNPQRRMRLLVDALSGGPNLERRPALYSEPGPEDDEALRAQGHIGQYLPEEARTRAADNRNIVLLPMVAGERTVLVALDLSDWSIADWWDVNPWKNTS